LTSSVIFVFSFCSTRLNLDDVEGVLLVRPLFAICLRKVRLLALRLLGDDLVELALTSLSVTLIPSWSALCWCRPPSA